MKILVGGSGGPLLDFAATSKKHTTSVKDGLEDMTFWRALAPTNG